MSSRLSILVARVLLVLGLLSVAWTSLLPPDDLPDAFGLSDKLLHFAGYAVLGVLGVLSGLRWPIAAVVALGWGLLLEVAQGLLGYRSFEWWDVVADGLGALLGAVIAARIAVEVSARKAASAHEAKRVWRKERRNRAGVAENPMNQAKAAARRGAPTWQMGANMIGSKCWFCGTRTFADVRQRGRNGVQQWGATYPEVDLIIAIDAGGTYEWDNLRIAHRHCAATRRAKPHLTTYGRPPRTYT
jgi:VanZ family protein